MRCSYWLQPSRAREHAEELARLAFALLGTSPEAAKWCKTISASLSVASQESASCRSGFAAACRRDRTFQQRAPRYELGSSTQRGGDRHDAAQRRGRSGLLCHLSSRNRFCAFVPVL